jgi:hypothetical protein
MCRSWWRRSMQIPRSLQLSNWYTTKHSPLHESSTRCFQRSPDSTSGAQLGIQVFAAGGKPHYFDHGHSCSPQPPCAAALGDWSGTVSLHPETGMRGEADYAGGTAQRFIAIVREYPPGSCRRKRADRSSALLENRKSRKCSYWLLYPFEYPLTNASRNCSLNSSLSMPFGIFA